jgi:hypothetical protein
VGENRNIFAYGTRQPKSHQIWPVGRATFLHDVIRRRDGIEKFGTSGKSARLAAGLNAAADQAVVVEEGTASTFRALEEVFGLHGLPLSLYTDRGSHYFSTPEAGGKVDRACPTQVGRALEHLGVEHIAAYSPQARGRSERVFHTLQDKLTKELALAGITTMEAANMFLRDVYIPAHNARFAVKPEQDGNAFVAITGINLAEILCVQEERLVGNDNCVSFNRLKLQIPASPLRAHFVKARVKVRQYHDGTHAIFHGPRCLGRYDRKGQAVDVIPIAA